jgi:hypothetical protein
MHFSLTDVWQGNGLPFMIEHFVGFRFAQPNLQIFAEN